MGHQNSHIDVDHDRRAFVHHRKKKPAEPDYHPVGQAHGDDGQQDPVGHGMSNEQGGPQDIMGQGGPPGMMGQGGPPGTMGMGGPLGTMGHGVLSGAGGPSSFNSPWAQKTMQGAAPGARMMPGPRGFPGAMGDGGTGS
ncbi:hypothetical protein B0A50_02109 [Salinomyces thailandicus]|uniref:Uncharacterized protein n=1 Tax=Salinomyces thailandicus TaxID=706561 RepID=A0A4U0U7C8_9PEZI|nr:hypothetical protein B0A50_02109 [Salinomyces thailandica]